MARYDGFTFFNELELLELRLHELYEHIDVFVLVEAPWTFQGDRKPLFFHQNRRRFRRFLPKIRHVVVEDEADSSDPWEREFHQRNAIRRGLHDARPNDLVLVSDADEIIRPAAIAEAERRACFSFLELDMFYYYLDWLAQAWCRAYAAPYAVLSTMPDLSRPRMLDRKYFDTGVPESVVPQAGWHFSWAGGVQRMIDKLGAFSHTEPSIQAWKDPTQLAAAVARREFFVDDMPLRPVTLSVLPDRVRHRAGSYHRRGLLSQRPPSLVDRLRRRLTF